MKQRVLALSLALFLLLSGCGQMDRSRGGSAVQSDQVSVHPAENASAPDQSARGENSAVGDKSAAQREGSVDDNKGAQGDSSEPEDLSELDTEELPWNLILVNKDRPIPEDYQVKLTTLSNGEQVDSRIYPALQKMFDDARAEGLGLFVVSGYRTSEKQEQLLREKIAAYKSEGNTDKEAEKLAKRWVAVPGTSEHQLGIAVDINADTEVCEKEDLYQWLANNAHKYGFVKRYPEDKTEITGIINEPWHYRYVGKRDAKEMHKQNLCLEEYLLERNTGS